MKKTIKVLIILIVLIILSMGALAALYFYTDIFKTPEQLFWKYFSNNSQIISLLENENENLQNNLKQVNSYTTNGNLKVSLQQNEEQPQEIQIDTTSRHDASTGRTYADAKLKVGENSISAAYINSDNIYAVKCDNIYQHYIGFRNSELKELARKFELDEEEISQIPDSINFENIMSEFKLSEEEKQNYKENYSNAIFQYISEENYSKLGKTNIEVNGINYEVNKYQLMVEGETLKNILINILTTIKNDTKTLEFVQKEGPNVEEFKKSIDENIAEIQESEVENTLTISVYEQKGKTIKTEIELSNTIRVSIDLLANKTVISLENIETENELDDNELYDANAEAKKMQVIISKIQNENNISNQIIIIPNTSSPELCMTITVMLGIVQNNTASNNYEIDLENADESQNVKINYAEQITTTNQIEEIMKLNNSNTVIINDYSKEQLEKFFNNIINKIYTISTATDKSNEESQKSENKNNESKKSQENNAENKTEEENNEIFEKAKNASEEIKKAMLTDDMVLIQATINADAILGEKINVEYVKKCVEEKTKDYTIVNSYGLSYDNISYKVNGKVIVADKDGQKYKMDFDNNTVEVQN